MIGATAQRRAAGRNYNDPGEATSKRKERNMRIWMLASLLYSVATAMGGDRGIAPLSQILDRVTATSSQSNPFSQSACLALLHP